MKFEPVSDSLWQRIPYGSARYRTQGSHGCVHVPYDVMHTLYTTVPDHTPLIVVDA